MAWRVVWGIRVVMATFSPMMALRRVDLPTLGRPTMAQTPEAVTEVLTTADGSRRPPTVPGTCSPGAAGQAATATSSGTAPVHVAMACSRDSTPSLA